MDLNILFGLKRLVSELGTPLDSVTPLYGDNKSALNSACNPVSMNNVKVLRSVVTSSDTIILPRKFHCPTYYILSQAQIVDILLNLLLRFAILLEQTDAVLSFSV